MSGQGRIRAKWRPPLWLVLGAVLAAVLALTAATWMAKPWLIGAFGPGGGFLAALALLAAAMGGLGWVLWRALAGPLVALADRAEAIRLGRDGGDVPLPHYGTRELRDLGLGVLEMADTLRAREEAIRSYTNHVTHELRTPLTTIAGAAELLDTVADDPGRVRHLGRELGLAADRLQDLLRLAKDMAAARMPVHHGETTLGALVPWLMQTYPDGNLRAQGCDVTLPLRQQGMKIVLGHLIGNALDAGASEITLRADPGPVLRVRDNGKGIAAGNRDRLFEPFFTTKREGGGTGMGLSIVASLLGAHGASVRLAEGDSGTTFEIRFADTGMLS